MRSNPALITGTVSWLSHEQLQTRIVGLVASLPNIVLQLERSAESIVQPKLYQGVRMAHHVYCGQLTFPHRWASFAAP